MRVLARIVLLIFIMTIFMTAFTCVGAWAAEVKGTDAAGNADEDDSGSSGGASSVGVSPSDVTAQTGELSGGFKSGVAGIAGSLLRYLQVAGSIAAVVILSIYGIKWFLASPQQKAMLKEHMWAYVIGALFVFGAPSLIMWVGGAIQKAVK